MATYNLWVTTTAIHQIRSNDQDTLIASVGLGVTGLGGGPHNMLTPAESMQLGTHVAGDLVEIFLLFQNVDVPDPTPEFPDGGLTVACPTCQKATVFQRFELMYRPD